MAREGGRPTITDVAWRAGVSKSSVSLVLRNSPLVKAATAAHIRRVMEELGYVYNRYAANLRSAKAGLVGLVINDLRNPFFTEFAASVQMALAEKGFATVLANTDEDPSLQNQVVGAMIEHGVAALIISPAYGHEQLTFGRIARAGIPALQVLRRVTEDVARFPLAMPDYAAGGRLATDHLLQGGARHIAFVGGLEGRGVTRERMQGYLAALAEAGQKPLVLEGRPGRAFGHEAALRLARDHPSVDGVVCFNDLVALGVLTGCAASGRQAGRDLKVVGFDDIEECAHAWPGLTSVRCDIAGFGRRMAFAVSDWLKGGLAPPPELYTPVELVIRDSSRG